MKISMYNYSKLLTVFIFLFLLSFIAKSNWKDKLIKQAAIQYEKLDKANRLNDKKGKSNLNNYLIELDPNWVEERPNKLILSSNYNTIRDALVTFNSSRKDKLRFYVIVVNNYLGYLDESIDPAKLPDNITNLKDLLTSISKETDYKRMQDELSEIPAGIDQALTIKGYDERVIYFMGLVKLYRLDKIPRYYKQDFLSLKGGRLPENEEQIRTTCFKNVNTNISNLQVEQIVKGLIHSVEVVIDKKEVASENVKCAETLDELVEKTKAIKQSKLSETITGFASLLDNGSKSNQLGSPYLLVDDAANFESSDFFTKNILPDKLSLLATNSNYKLYVVFKKIDFVLNQEERKKLVEEVYKKSSKAKQSNTLLLVVPYYQTLCTGQSWFFGMPVNKSTGMLMPVVNGTDASLISQMNSAITGIGTWSERFDNAFKNIPKKYTAYAFSFLFDGGLIFNGKIEETNVTGKENIIEVKLVEDERFDQLSEAYKDYSSTAQANAYPGTPVQTQNIIAAAEKYKATSDAILASPANFKAVSNLNLVSSKINEALALEFCKWYAVRKKFGAAAYFSSPENEIFYGGTNPLNVQDALVLIDIGSGLSALVGFDAIFESIGAYYAFKNNLYAEATMYAGAAAVPFLSSAVRRGIMEGSTYMLKTVKGTYVTRPRNVLGCGYFFDIENNFSPFLKNSIELKNFSTLAKYKAEKEFIEKFEEGLLKSEDHVSLVNQNPTLIGEYNDYYKKEKGDWETFLGKKGLKGSSEIDYLLSKVDASLRDALRADLEDEAFKAKIIGKAELIESWKCLNADKLIRKNEADLVKVYDYLKNNPTKLEEATKGFTNAKDRRKWLDELGSLKNIEELVSSLKKSVLVKISKNPKYSLKLTDGELTQLAKLGQELKLAEDEIEAFILAHSRRWKKEDVNDMILIMQSIVKKNSNNNIGFKPNYNMLKTYKEAQLKMVEGGYLDPEIYLTETYITSHKQYFYNDGSYFVNQQAYDDYIKDKPIVGIQEDNSLFITTKMVADEVQNKAGQKLYDYEKLLGFSPGHFTTKGAVWRIDIKNPQNFNLRIPSGNEVGANHWWHPGGYTSGGTIEIVTNRIPKELNGEIIITENNLIK